MGKSIPEKATIYKQFIKTYNLRGKIRRIYAIHNSLDSLRNLHIIVKMQFAKIINVDQQALACNEVHCL